MKLSFGSVKCWLFFVGAFKKIFLSDLGGAETDRNKSEQVLATLALKSIKVTVEVLNSAYRLVFFPLSSSAQIFKYHLIWIPLGKRCTLQFAVVTSIPCYRT